MEERGRREGVWLIERSAILGRKLHPPWLPDYAYYYPYTDPATKGPDWGQPEYRLELPAELLFYSPGDHNWWLGQFKNEALTWTLAGNTAGYGNLADGRPFWTGYFSGTAFGVLFYYPGDHNWWLGEFINESLTWKLVGNSKQIESFDGIKSWTGNFTGSTCTDLVLYDENDRVWWLGKLRHGALEWKLMGRFPIFV